MSRDVFLHYALQIIVLKRITLGKYFTFDFLLIKQVIYLFDI